MRVFRLLAAKKQLEQKQVADYAMVPVRDARELLYRMLRAGFVTLQARPFLPLPTAGGPCGPPCAPCSPPRQCHSDAMVATWAPLGYSFPQARGVCESFRERLRSGTVGAAA